MSMPETPVAAPDPEEHPGEWIRGSLRFPSIEPSGTSSGKQDPSHEKLLAINEELRSANAELKARAEEAAKINDDLQNFIAASGIAIVFIDSAMRIQRYTPHAANIFNLRPSDINRPLPDIKDRLNYESLAQDAKKAFQTLQTIERAIENADGRHYLARIRPCRTTDGRTEGAVLTFVDVTALWQAEEAVRAGEERLRIAAETTRDYAIVTIDEDGLVTSWNAGAERVFGYSEEEIIGQPLALLFTPEDRAAGVPGHERFTALKEGRAEDERWHIRKDGSRFYCSGIMTPLQGKGMKGFAKIARDLTGNKQQEALREAMLQREKASSSQARAANELKDRFLAVMSHELKHPLNLIQVNTELLINQPGVKTLPPVLRAGENIRQAVASQVKIIDDLLDLSRARTGKLTFKITSVALDELLATIVEAAAGNAGKKGLTLGFEKEDGTIVQCDRVRTEQICWNLINNAIKFTPQGGKVQVSLAREDGFARLSVSDTGQGISADFLPHVFGMFSQGQGTQAQAGGLGVGLALVQELATAQGGRVLAESPGPGRGAAFSVWLPLESREAQTAREDEAPGVAAGSLEGLRILAVDDMLDALEPFADLLRLDGAVVDTAGTGEQALEALESSAYDLLISDLGMTGMDGFALIGEIRKRPTLQRIPALALSGYGRQADVQRALQLGFDGHLSKPVTLAKLRQAVATLKSMRAC